MCVARWLINSGTFRNIKSDERTHRPQPILYFIYFDSVTSKVPSRLVLFNQGPAKLWLPAGATVLLSLLLLLIFSIFVLSYLRTRDIRYMLRISFTDYTSWAKQSCNFHLQICIINHSRIMIDVISFDNIQMQVNRVMLKNYNINIFNKY